MTSEKLSVKDNKEIRRIKNVRKRHLLNNFIIEQLYYSDGHGYFKEFYANLYE